MREIYALLFFIIVGSIALWRLYKDKDIFSPIVMLCLLAMVRYLPGILYMKGNRFIAINDESAFYCFLYETIAVVCTAFGYMIYKGTHHSTHYYVTYKSLIPIKVVVPILYAIGFTGGIMFLNRSGGVFLLLQGVTGIEAGDGNGYIQALMYLMVTAMVVYLHERHEKKLRTINLTLILMFCGYAAFYVVLTGRSPVLEAMMILVMVYHYDVRRIRLFDFFKPKAIAIILLCALFIVIMPMFRSSVGYTNFSLSRAVMDGFENIANVFEELSYTGRDAFVYMNYNFSNYWYGANIINLLCAPLPSRVFTWKPPVDDGMYLANAAIGYFVKPPATNLPWYNSFPLSTPSGLYINFGIIGLIVGTIILGWLYGKIYSMLKQTDFDIVLIIFYQLVIYQLEFSSLSIVQTLVQLLVPVIFLKIFSGWRLHRTSNVKMYSQ